MVYTDYRDVIADGNVNTVIIMTLCDAYINIAIDAMNAG